MSPCSGINLAMLLQQRQPSCKVLLFSGPWAWGQPFQVARSSGLEFETIPKLVDPKELLKKVLAMTTGICNSLAEDRAIQTYNHNVQETLSWLKAAIGKHKNGHAE